MEHPAWAVVEAALGELEDNGDVQLTTARRYVVGLVVRRLVEHGVTLPVLPGRPAADCANFKVVYEQLVSDGVDANRRPTRRKHPTTTEV